MFSLKLPIWNKAWSEIEWKANFKTSIEDFRVEEVLSFPLAEATLTNSGEEHLYLCIEKKSLTTLQVVSILSDYFEVNPSNIGYAGLKDKNAITYQWLSIYLPGKVRSIDIEMLIGSQLITNPAPKEINQVSNRKTREHCKILRAVWHKAKLRRGAISRNHFKIICRGKQQIPETMEQRLQLISKKGFPNYFGEQRFGWKGSNLQSISDWFGGKKLADKKLQGLLLSAARSFLFNLILQIRVTQENWDKPLQGDCFILQGSTKFFKQQFIDETILNRCDSGDIHPSGVLWGIGGGELTEHAKVIENKVLNGFEEWCQALEERGLESAQRPLRCIPQQFSWKQLNNTDLLLEFALPAGCYATSLLRELGELSEKKSV